MDESTESPPLVETTSTAGLRFTETVWAHLKVHTDTNKRIRRTSVQLNCDRYRMSVGYAVREQQYSFAFKIATMEWQRFHYEKSRGDKAEKSLFKICAYINE